MFGKRITLFKLFGFEVRIDVSWIIIAVLITWSLADGVFPNYVKHLSPATYWGMGFLGALGLFASVVLHELSHSLVARQFGLPITGITLFIFGGVAEMEEEPPNPKAEFFMAVAGPIASVIIGLVCLGGYWAVRDPAHLAPLVAILGYLGWINLVLAAFNLLPAFPLDGGRALRSILWGAKKNLQWATHVASTIGSGFGFLLIAWGVVSMIRGDLVGGIWWLLIGLFLRGASQMSYQQLLVRGALEGMPASRFMRSDPVTVSPAASIHDLVEEYVYKYHYKMFPVVSGDRLVGCVTTRQVKDLPREEWDSTSVQALAQRCSADNSVPPDADASEVLKLMHKTGNSRLMVVSDGHLSGVITLKDLLKFISLKMDLEGGTTKHAVG